MKTLLFLLTALYCGSSFGQDKMVMTINGKQNDILGYAMDPDGTGDTRSISILGPMQNSLTALQMSYASANPISTIYITISEPGKQVTSMKITDATVYALKQYVSNYSNGVFSISSSGTVNTEIKCKFKILLTRVGDVNINDDVPGMNNNKPWEIIPDDKLKGMSGQLRYHMPDFAMYTHTEVFDAGTEKRVGSFFGDGSQDLLPGQYDIMLGKYRINAVPIEKGKITLLKLGGFEYSNYGGVEIVDDKNQKITHAGPFKILLPAGTYTIGGNKRKSFVIKDGEVTIF